MYLSYGKITNYIFPKLMCFLAVDSSLLPSDLDH
jgi:hypothetical protein